MDTAKLQKVIEATDFQDLDLSKFSQEEIDWLLDPSNYNQNNFKDGQKVEVTMLDEVRRGFVAKQLDDRHFLVRLETPFSRINRGKNFLKVYRDFAHQVTREIV